MARRVAGLGEVVFSGDPQDELVAFGLGSCVGLVARDLRYSAWVLGHVVLPGPEPANSPPDKPAWYAERGVETVLGMLQRLVGGPARAEVEIFGGAVAVGGLTSFEIGRRNVLAVRKALWRRGLVPVREDVEGEESRTVSVHLAHNRVHVRRPGEARRHA